MLQIYQQHMYAVNLLFVHIPNMLYWIESWTDEAIKLQCTSCHVQGTSLRWSWRWTHCGYDEDKDTGSSNNQVGCGVSKYSIRSKGLKSVLRKYLMHHKTASTSLSRVNPCSHVVYTPSVICFRVCCEMTDSIWHPFVIMCSYLPFYHLEQVNPFSSDRNKAFNSTTTGYFLVFAVLLT